MGDSPRYCQKIVIFRWDEDPKGEGVMQEEIFAWFLREFHQISRKKSFAWADCNALLAGCKH